MEHASDYLAAKRELIDVALDRYLPKPTDEPVLVHECMRYSASGGKRFRPILALAVAGMLGCPEARALPSCVAVELIHTHSLILDDLPCMDDDDFRRGRLTSHRRFGESVALLAADALLNLAILILGSTHRLAGIRAEVALDLIREVGESVGTAGVIGGQADDIAYDGGTGGQAVDCAMVQRICLGKTASLFRLSARAGALVADATPEEVEAVSTYAVELGLAFQIVDDIQDGRERGRRAKTPGKVEPSYVAAHGIEAAWSLAVEATDRAIAALARFGDRAERLRQLARLNLVRES